jgi:hypothetical protein
MEQGGGRRVTVQEMIDQLQLIEDKSKMLVVPGFDENGFDLAGSLEPIEIY